LLASLILLAHLMHTVIGLMDEKFRQLRQKIASRKRLFADICALTTYLCFEGWTPLLDFMLQGLERRHSWLDIVQRGAK
jgi:hypothetical protein